MVNLLIRFIIFDVKVPLTNCYCYEALEIGLAPASDCWCVRSAEHCLLKTGVCTGLGYLVQLSTKSTGAVLEQFVSLVDHQPFDAVIVDKK